MRKDGQYLVRLTGSGAVVFRLWKAGAPEEAATPPGAVTSGRWHHVVCTWDGSTMTIYVDGAVGATAALAGPADVSSSALYLGSSMGAYDWFPGTIDEAAVYAFALSAARVQAHFDAANAIDSVAPAVSMPAPAAGSTTDATPNVGGVAGTAPGDLAAVTVKLYRGSSAEGTPVRTLSGVRRPAGTFSVRVAPPLPSGVYTVQTEQSDHAGNAGRSAPASFTVDAEAAPVLLAAGDIAACNTIGDEATAALLDGLPGTVATLGDHVYEYNTAADFERCYDPTWGRHQARTRPTVGDHEYLLSAAPYFDYFGPAAGDPANGFYGYDVGDWHIVSLNSACGAIGGCEAGSRQEQWLRAELAAHPATCTLALIHAPRFSSGNVHGGTSSVRALWQALYDHGADVVLSGDDHIYERFAPQTPDGVADPLGVRQWVIGTGGRSHYAIGTIKPNSEVREPGTFGILQLTLRPSGYDWRFVPEAGKTFTDAGEASCH